jgi:hypothetical protein
MKKYWNEENNVKYNWFYMPWRGQHINLLEIEICTFVNYINIVPVPYPGLVNISNFKIYFILLKNTFSHTRTGRMWKRSN